MSVKSGSPNAEWVKTRDTGCDISCGTAKVKSGADYTGKDTNGICTSAEDAAADKTGKVKNITGAENVTNSVKHVGSEIINAVKTSAEAGWKMVHGTAKD